MEEVTGATGDLATAGAGIASAEARGAGSRGTGVKTLALATPATVIARASMRKPRFFIGRSPSQKRPPPIDDRTDNERGLRTFRDETP